MPYSVKLLESHDHIILVTFTGMMTGQDVSHAVRDVVKLAESMPRPVYQIGDFRAADGTFMSVLNISATFPNMWRAYAVKNITGPIAVNDLSNPFLRLSSQLARAMNLSDLITFGSIEAAIDYIQKRDSEQESKS